MFLHGRVALSLLTTDALTGRAFMRVCSLVDARWFDDTDPAQHQHIVPRTYWSDHRDGYARATTPFNDCSAAARRLVQDWSGWAAAAPTTPDKEHSDSD